MRLFSREAKPTERHNPAPLKASSTSTQRPTLPKDLQALGYINRFGWLTVSQVTFLLYGECPDNPHATLYKKTRKILAHLHEKRWIYIRLLPNNSRAYLLSKEGAIFLQDSVGIHAIPGVNILTSHPTICRKTGRPNGAKAKSPNWIHRWVANEFVIRNGLINALTEVDIFRKHAPFPKQYNHLTGNSRRSRSWKGKAPDALLIREENGVKYLTWIEVENAKRRTGGYLDTDESNQRGGLNSLAIWLANAFKEDIIEGLVRIEKIVFIVVTSKDTEHRLERFLFPIYDSLSDLLESWYPTELEEKQAEIFRHIFVEEYVLGKGPRLLEIKKEVFEGRPTTMEDIAYLFSLELMQERPTPRPRTDGKIKV